MAELAAVDGERLSDNVGDEQLLRELKSLDLTQPNRNRNESFLNTRFPNLNHS